MEKLVVAESVKGKFGDQLKDVAGSYFSFSKFYKGPTDFAVGTVLDVEIYATAKGNKYINKAIVMDQAPVKEPTKAVEKKAVKKAEAVVDKAVPTKYGKPMSEYELQVERRISRAGVMQAVLQSPSLAPFSGDELKTKAEDLFHWALGIVNG